MYLFVAALLLFQGLVVYISTLIIATLFLVALLEFVILYNMLLYII